MTTPTNNDGPRIWTTAELEKEAQIALNGFVSRRLAEPGHNYLTHVENSRKSLTRLLRTLEKVDFSKPDADLIRSILLDEDLFSALRYLAGPPISEDDLGVLVTKNIKGFNKTGIKNQDDIPVSVFTLICQLADPFRFPWIVQRRKATSGEIKAAINSTMTMHAAQRLQTARRGYGKVVEQQLEARLIELDFIKISGGKKKPKKGTSPSTSPAFPPKGVIQNPSHHPTYPYFYGECTVYGRKVDQFIALKNGRMVAVEAKDSSSGLNSTKRLLNDTSAKAKSYEVAAGKHIISVALLSGVFKLSNLETAQKAGLYLVWSHDLDEFISWIKAQG